MSNMDLANAILPQYPTQAKPHFAEFLNGIYANTTAAKVIKHVSFAPFGDEVGPITSLVARFTWDTTVFPAAVKPWYERELSSAVRKGLKDNGFEKWLARALQDGHEVGADIELNAISKDHLFLLHAFAITPCKGITMLTLPSQWYAHTDKAVKEELQECFPELNVSFRVSNKDHTLVRIGGPENYSAPSSAAPVQSVESAKKEFLKRPRCVRCKNMKKSCNRERPCDRCSIVGLGIADCILEEASYSRNGIYGGNHTKGRSRRKTPHVEADQDDGYVNVTGDYDQDPAPDQEAAPDTETHADVRDDRDDAAAENGFTHILFFEQVEEYLRKKDRMQNFLELYRSFFTGEKSFEDLLKESGTFLDEQSDLFAYLKDHMRTGENRVTLGHAFTNFLDR